MKRFLTAVFAAVLLFSFTDASARGDRRHAGPRTGSVVGGFGVSFGYVHSAYRLSDWATDERNTAAGLNGFNVGVTKDFTILDEALYFQTGLMYTYQNKPDNSIDNMFGRVVGDRDEHYLSIPLKIKYEYNVMDNLSVFVMGGPTLDAGLSSKMKYRATVGGENLAVEYNFHSGKIKSNSAVLDSYVAPLKNTYRRFDVQLGASAGVRFFEIFEAQIGYDWGLVNKFKGDNAGDLKMRRQQLYISLGLRF